MYCDMVEPREKSSSPSEPPVNLILRTVGLLENALSNTLQFIKQESTNDSYTSEEKREMKKDAVEFRNLQAKLAHFLKGVVSVK